MSRTTLSRRNGIAPQDHHFDFLERFNAKERQRAKKPVPLSVKEHVANRKQLSTVRFVKPKYSEETQINVGGIFRKWRRYCDEKKVGDWKATMLSLTRETIMDFFLFVCGNYKIKSWGTSEEYMRQFQQLYTTVTGQYMDRNDSKEVYKYHHHVLVPLFGLRAPNVDGKPVLNVDSLRVLLTFNIAYDTSVFGLGRQRIQLSGCYQLLCYTGVRPAELVDSQRKAPKDDSIKTLFGCKVVQEIESDDGLDEAMDEESRIVDQLLLQETIKRGRPKALCYEDILFMLVRHPVTGKATPAMAIKFIHHKGADNKPKPTIFFFTPTKKLIFDIIMVILALALHDRAFDARSLTDARSVLSKQVWGPKDSMPFRWKEDKLKIPIVRRIEGGKSLSDTKAMPYSKLHYDMGRQSLESGYEKAFTPRFARRGTGNAANGDAPDTVRDQMMRHNPGFLTFFSAYLNEIVQFDIQNAFLEEEKQSGLFRMFAHVSLTRDPRATRDMVPKEVWANAAPDPEIEALKKKRAALKRGKYRIEGCEDEKEVRILTDQIRTKEAARDTRIVKDYREYHFHHLPTWEIEAQARGENEEEYGEPVINLAIPARAIQAKILCQQPDDWTEQEMFEYRIKAIDSMVAYCDMKESGRINRNKQRTLVGPSTKQESPSLSVAYDPESGPDLFPLLMDSSQCPDCIGDEQLPLEERTFRWCRSTVRNDHFDDQHLPERERTAQRSEAIRCDHPKCRSATFKHLDHFRNHVLSVHGVPLRSTEQVNQRRQKKAKCRQMSSSKRQ